jgi:hypothetical protein
VYRIHNINTKCPIKNMLLWQENKLRVYIYEVSICDMKSQLHHCTSDIHKNEYLYFVVHLQRWENSMFFFDKSFLCISVSCLESLLCLNVLHVLFNFFFMIWARFMISSDKFGLQVTYNSRRFAFYKREFRFGIN